MVYIASHFTAFGVSVNSGASIKPVAKSSTVPRQSTHKKGAIRPSAKSDDNMSRNAIREEMEPANFKSKDEKLKDSGYVHGNKD